MPTIDDSNTCDFSRYDGKANTFLYENKTYERGEELGRGANAIVWKFKKVDVVDGASSPEYVAVKIPLATDRDMKDEFNIESKWNQTIYGIASVSEKSPSALLMPYIEGEDLKAVINSLIKDQLYYKALSLFIKFCQAVQDLYVTHQCVHDDLKADNAILTKDGKIKLIDFARATKIGDSLPYDVSALQKLPARIREGYNLAPELYTMTQEKAIADPAQNVYRLSVDLKRFFGPSNSSEEWKVAGLKEVHVKMSNRSPSDRWLLEEAIVAMQSCKQRCWAQLFQLPPRGSSSPFMKGVCASVYRN